MLWAFKPGYDVGKEFVTEHNGAVIMQVRERWKQILLDGTDRVTLTVLMWEEYPSWSAESASDIVKAEVNSMPRNSIGIEWHHWDMLLRDC